MTREDIIFAYNMKTELEAAKNELARMPARMVELQKIIEDRETKLRGIGL